MCPPPCGPKRPARNPRVKMSDLYPAPKYIKDRRGGFYTADEKRLVIMSPRTKGKYEVKDGCEIIADKALAEHRNLEELVLPKSLKKIGGGAFFCMTALHTVKILSDSCLIGKKAFGGCRNLKKVSVPVGCKEYYSLLCPEVADKITEE